MSGPTRVVGTAIAPERRIATFSGWARAIRFGTSSPKKTRKTASPSVTRDERQRPRHRGQPGNERQPRGDLPGQAQDADDAGDQGRERQP